MHNLTAEDAFNLLCAEKIGEGIHRTVYKCRLRDDLVVKVETPQDWRFFANVAEHRLWSNNQHYTKVADWLAPCEFLSPDGRLSLQKRCEPIRSTDVLPDMLPTFLTDIKRENFGWFKGKLVCFDYALYLDNPNVKFKKANWT